MPEERIFEMMHPPKFRGPKYEELIRRTLEGTLKWKEIVFREFMGFRQGYKARRFPLFPSIIIFSEPAGCTLFPQHKIVLGWMRIRYQLVDTRLKEAVRKQIALAGGDSLSAN